LVPILSPDNNAFIYSAELNISGRYDSYSDFGSTFNPKFAADAEIIDGLKIRANWSRSFVAPSMRSVGDPLYGTYSNSTARAISSIAAVSVARFPEVAQIPGIPCSGGSCTVGNNIQGIVVDTGNPNVGPQKGETWSVGADISPTLVPGLTASVTMFSNTVRGGITSPCAPGCILNNGGLNYLFSVYPNGATDAQIAAKVHDVPIVSVFPSNAYYIYVRPQTNALDLDVKGLDISANYVFDTDFGQFSAGGSITQFLRYKQAFAGGARYSILNTVGVNSTFPAIARQARFNVGWNYDVFSVELFVNNVGGYKNWSSGTINPLTLDANGNPSGGGDYVESFTTMDLHMAYDFSQSGPLGESQVYLDITNILDEQPPFYNTAQGYGSFGANPLGRVMSVGIRARW
jgi:iron complex outermembrane receptor protein